MQNWDREKDEKGLKCAPLQLVSLDHQLLIATLWERERERERERENLELAFFG